MKQLHLKSVMCIMENNLYLIVVLTYVLFQPIYPTPRALRSKQIQYSLRSYMFQYSHTAIILSPAIFYTMIYKKYPVLCVRCVHLVCILYQFQNRNKNSIVLPNS